MRLFAHRGCPAHGPENTVSAIPIAAPHVDAVEVDVRRCGSGDLVVFHDEKLGRLLRHRDGTPASGRVADTDLSTLRSLRVGRSDARVPRFSDVVDAAEAHGLALNVELKEVGVATDVAAALDDFDGEVLVSSFEPRALKKLRRVADHPVGLIVGYRGYGDDVAAWQGGLRTADRLGADALHPNKELVLAADDPAARVGRAHDAGLAVNTWTVRSPDPVPELREAGVDGLIVDDWTVVDG